MRMCKKCCYQGKGKKRAGVAVASTEVGMQPYMPVKLPLSREAHLKAMAVGLKAANAVLTSPLYADPMLPLVATLPIFKATLENPSLVPKDKGQVAEAGSYLTKWLLTVAALVDKSMPAMVVLMMPSHIVREVGGEGQAKPSHLATAVD